MKTLVFNQRETTEVYFMMVELNNHNKKLVKQDEKHLLQGLLTIEDFQETKRKLAYSEKLLEFFRENNTTFITELPF